MVTVPLADTYVMDNLDIALLEVVLGPEALADLQMMVSDCHDEALLLQHYSATR